MHPAAVFERLREDQKELLSFGSVLSNYTGDYA
jgi:hypothetical protein